MRFTTRAVRIAVFLLLASASLRAQQGTASVTGQVSGVAAVSAHEPARVLSGEARVAARHPAAPLVFSLSGRGGGETRVDIPVQLRSNAAFTLAASCLTSGATLEAFAVVEVGGAGRLVYPGAAARVQIPAAFDGRAGALTRRAGGVDLSSPVAILSGPTVSMGGPLDSPANMLEVVLRVVLNAPPGEQDWRAELKVSAAPHRGAEHLRRDDSPAGRQE